MIPMRAVNAIADQQARYQMNSPLLFSLFQALDVERRIDVLELAPATENSLEYYSQFHCKLYLPSCQNELLSLPKSAAEDQPPLAELIKRCIPLSSYTPHALDVLLLWDLPNYLDKPVLSALIDYLLPYLHKNTVLHTYIHTSQHMPQQPGSYRLLPEHRVMVEMSSACTKSSPGYYQELMNKVFKPFRVDRGMLLTNGLQEYVLRLK